jgi:hypothetical protein
VSAESIRLDGRRESVAVSVEVETPHRSLRIRPPRSAVATIQIGERHVARVVPNVPVIWADPPAGGRLLTQTVAVELFGPASALQSLREESLSAEIKTSDIPAGAESAQPRIKLPHEADTLIHIKTLTPKRVRVKFNGR